MSIELSEQEQLRRQSLAALRELGIDPYPAARYEVTATAREIADNYDEARGAARNRLQDRGLHLDVAALVEELAHRGDDLGAPDEYVAHLRVHHQVDVALAVADFGVGEGVERLAVLGLDDGQRADRLRSTPCTPSRRPCAPTCSPAASR